MENGLIFQPRCQTTFLAPKDDKVILVYAFNGNGQYHKSMHLYLSDMEKRAVRRVRPKKEKQ